jgi:hypothetical protein
MHSQSQTAFKGVTSGKDVVSYEAFSLSATTMAPDGAVIASVIVRNQTRASRGEEVGLFVDDAEHRQSDGARGRGYSTVHLRKGEARLVQFVITPLDLAIFHAAKGAEMVARSYVIGIGPSLACQARLNLARRSPLNRPKTLRAAVASAAARRFF